MTPNLSRASFLQSLVRSAAIAAIAMGASLATHAAPFELPQLAALLGQVKSGNATFTERRQVRELDQTLESSGRLSFTSPDVFVRETLKPRIEKLAVQGNTLTMSRGSRSRTVPLDSVPEAQVMVEAVRGTLTGNREILERHFSTQVGGSAARWTLDLAPRDARLREQVSAIRVSGQQTQLDEIQIDLPGGDRSVMRIAPAP